MMARKNAIAPIYFTDQELEEVWWAIHNFTRPGQTKREIFAQGRAAEKIDTAKRYRERNKRLRQKGEIPWENPKTT